MRYEFTVEHNNEVVTVANADDLKNLLQKEPYFNRVVVESFAMFSAKDYDYDFDKYLEEEWEGILEGNNGNGYIIINEGWE